MFYYKNLLVLILFLIVGQIIIPAQSPMPLEKKDIEQPRRAFDNSIVYGPSPQAFERAGDRAVADGDFYAGMKYFHNTLLANEENVAVLMKYAEASRQAGAIEEAAKTYRNVASLDPKREFPSAVFWLAMCEKMQGKYDAAYQHFQNFEKIKGADAQMLATAKAEIEHCIWAMEVMNAPEVGVTLQRLDDTVNTLQSDFAPVQRDSTLFYSSFRDTAWGDKHFPARPILKILEKVEGEMPVFSKLNEPKRHTAHTAFSPDGEWMIYNQCDYVAAAKVQCELFMSKHFGNEWLTGVRLPEIINTPGKTTTQPSIGRDADGSLALFFVSDRDGGRGGLDIWKSRFSPDGIFSMPENLADINTAGDDITPFFDFGTNHLYFSSTGLRSLGGFDIYKSEFVDGKFQEPQHLGVPFNSCANDIYFSNSTNGESAYFSSNRQNSQNLTDEICCYDIYKTEYLALKMEGLAFSKLSGDPLDEVVFTIREKLFPKLEKTYFSGETNRTEVPVLRDKTYEIIANREGYKPDTIEIATKDLPLDRRFVGKLYLEPSDFEMIALSFNQFSKAPLTGVKIKLIEMKDKIPVRQKDEQDTREGNEASLAVRLETQYMIVGLKDKFFPDTVILASNELKPGTKTTKRLYLTPSSLDNLLPLALYFDNDQPDPNTRRETTLQAYNQTYEQYISRKEVFLNQFSQGLPADRRTAAVEKLNVFFQNDVTGGYLKLDNFRENLPLFLEAGYKVEIMVKGFASPLANSAYNLALTKRRIASVMNYFRKIDDGKFNAFLITGQLAVIEVPYGETTAPAGLNDNPRDKRLSVYSVEASKERRAEILEVRLVRQFKN